MPDVGHRVKVKFRPCKVCAAPMIVRDQHLAPRDGEQVVVEKDRDGSLWVVIHATDCPDRVPEQFLAFTETAEEFAGD